MIVVCEPGPLGAALKTVASIVNKTDAVENARDRELRMGRAMFVAGGGR